MLILIFLFGLAWLVAYRMAQKDYYDAKVLFLLLMGLFFCFCLIWQSGHEWPGIADPAFLARATIWVIAVLVGFVPGIFFSNGFTRSKRSAP